MLRNNNCAGPQGDYKSVQTVMFECKKRQWANNYNGTSFGETRQIILFLVL